MIQEKNYNTLSTKSLLFTIGMLPLLLFLSPSANGWLLQTSNMIDYWHFYFSTESVFVILMFSYKSLIEREFKKATLLSLIGMMIFSFAFYLSLFTEINKAFIPFFHPVALAVPINCLFERRYLLAVFTYILGYNLSLFPMLGSILPIIFLTLWAGGGLENVYGTKIARFLTRLLIYNAIGFLLLTFFTMLSIPDIKTMTVSFSIVHERISAVIAIIAIYVLFAKYLKHYTAVYGRKYYFLSFIPGLWIIPLFGIFIEKKSGEEQVGE